MFVVTTRILLFLAGRVGQGITPTDNLAGPSTAAHSEGKES